LAKIGFDARRMYAVINQVVTPKKIRAFALISDTPNGRPRVRMISGELTSVWLGRQYGTLVAEGETDTYGRPIGGYFHDTQWAAKLGGGWHDASRQDNVSNAPGYGVTYDNASNFCVHGPKAGCNPKKG
jgi:hypothetical protein